MKESIKHWRKKHPQKHRRYGEKRERDIKELEKLLHEVYDYDDEFDDLWWIDTYEY